MIAGFKKSGPDHSCLVGAGMSRHLKLRYVRPIVPVHFHDVTDDKIW